MSANRIVSSESEELILVDKDDRETGTLSKALCHDGDGILHRAFSVFLFDRHGALLLQQRSGDKRLWPLYWSNSCCSHPRKGESMNEATGRRLLQELNIRAELEYVYKFSYQARYKDLGSEHELCSVYLGRSDDDVRANESEIQAIRYLEPAELERELAERPEHFTPWFRMEWQELCDKYADQLEKYVNVGDS
ncbi:MAG: isopentenyl-diphosphate Delta-isomerase [Woeseiaceae bacterium]|nr:isopentenyl-diphosphate Delta-isomerase [Woeseiaceae bacterium]